jgi:hypothetical protein
MGTIQILNMVGNKTNDSHYQRQKYNLCNKKYISSEWKISKQ